MNNTRIRRIVAMTLATLGLVAGIGLGSTQSSTQAGEGIWWGTGKVQKSTSFGEGIWW